jgi:glycosyltransferase involved in cell wall biosynthesis
MRVSCIMPTTEKRKAFHPLAIEYFHRQDYQDKELIMFDGEGTIGAKRNACCKMATGDIILHLDDDDWYAPDWISKAVACLINNDAAIVGLNNAYFYRPTDQRLWQYRYPDNWRKWVAGATMCYRKDFWQQHRFENIQVGEDNNFVLNTNSRIAFIDYPEGFVSILHNNTSPKHTNDKLWHPQPAILAEKLLGNDFNKYNFLTLD